MCKIKIKEKIVIKTGHKRCPEGGSIVMKYHNPVPA
jgi:hypothetical protein